MEIGQRMWPGLQAPRAMPSLLAPCYPLATEKWELPMCEEEWEKSKTAKAINEQVGPGPFPTPVALEQQQNHVHMCVTYQWKMTLLTAECALVNILWPDQSDWQLTKVRACEYFSNSYESSFPLPLPQPKPPSSLAWAPTSFCTSTLMANSPLSK